MSYQITIQTESPTEIQLLLFVSQLYRSQIAEVAKPGEPLQKLLNMIRILDPEILQWIAKSEPEKCVQILESCNEIGAAVRAALMER